MGARLVKFEFCPEENEQIEAVVRIPEEKRSVIHGVVKDWKNKVVKDAVVKLFEVIEKHNCYNLKPISHTFTDDWGQFIFGPLCPNKKYVVKVWFNDIKVRELIVSPEDEEYEKDFDNLSSDKNYSCQNLQQEDEE